MKLKPTSSLSVLLIEDSIEIQDAFIQSMEGSDSVSINGTVDNSSSAILLLEQGGFEAVVIDLRLRAGSGIHVLDHLKNNGNVRNIFRVVLSNHTTPAFKKVCTDLGAEYVFDKSLEFERAVDVLQQHARSRLAIA